MNNLIEKYVYDVVRRLPEKMRSEVTRELRSNIEEMLSDNPQEEEIIEILESLGHPRVLASEYRGKDRYLIGPEYYDDYIMVLKIVLIVFASISVLFGAISNIINPDATTAIGIIVEVLWETLGDAISAVLSGFAIVTAAFVAIDRLNKEGRKQKFNVLSLPELPDDKQKVIPRFGTTVSLIVNAVFSFAFIYLLYTNSLNFIWFSNGGTTISGPIFTDAVIRPLIPLLILSAVANVSLDAFKLIKKRWDISVVGVHTFVKIIAAVIAVVVLMKPDLIDAAFINQIATIFDSTFSAVESGTSTALLILSILIGFSTFVDLVKTWSTLGKRHFDKIKEEVKKL